MAVTLPVDGLAGSYHFEYTTSVVRTLYANAASTILLIGDKDKNLITAADLANYNQALNVLKDLAKRLQPGTALPLDSPITLQMARSIDSLIKLTQAVNTGSQASINNGIGLNSLTELSLWKDLYFAGVKGILASAVRAGGESSTRSLQSFVELEYIKAGNDLIFDALTTLKDAMSITKQALEVLAKVQSLKNRAVVEDRTYNIASQWDVGLRPNQRGTFHTHTGVLGPVGGSSVSFTFTNVNVKSVANIYDEDLKGELETRLLINVDPTFAASIEAQGVALKAELTAIIDELNRVNPGGGTDSLQGRLQQVVDEMSLKGAGKDIQFWVLDNYNDADTNTTQTTFVKSEFKPDKGGEYQRNLTNAITTAETLNDEQKADLKTSIFNFEEFYKSSSAILRILNRIIEKMASQINR